MGKWYIIHTIAVFAALSCVAGVCAAALISSEIGVAGDVG